MYIVQENTEISQRKGRLWVRPWKEEGDLLDGIGIV